MRLRSVFLWLFLSLLPFQFLIAQDEPAYDEADTIRTVKITNIYLLGNKKTKPQIIHRELNFEIGDTVNIGRLRKIAARDEQKLFNLGLFNTIDITILDGTDNEVEMFVKVSERWYFFVIPIFKLVDRNFNDWWVNRNRDLSRVNYGVRAFHYNMRGRNEKLKLTARFGFTRNFSLNYVAPFIDKKQKSGLSVDFSYQERKNIAFNTINHIPEFYTSPNIISRFFSPAIAYTYRNGFFNRHSFTIDYFQQQLADSVHILNPEYTRSGENRQQFFRLSYSFVRDLRDLRNYPLHGFFLSGRIDRLGLRSDGDANQWRLSARFSRYLDFKRGFYFATTNFGLWSTQEGQAYNLFNAVGFGRTLVRGYELDLIETPMYFLQKNSLRKLLFEGQKDLKRFVPVKQFQKLPYALYLKVFYDHGWAQKYPGYAGSNRLTQKYLYGVGAGLDFVSSYDFVLRLEYSRNAESKNNFFVNFKAAL
ncbi:MAG: BamA/TamA family outer membrane protein [Cyclobacteriaceae bacterium]